jgi:hypothetical protein
LINEQLTKAQELMKMAPVPPPGMELERPPGMAITTPADTPAPDAVTVSGADEGGEELREAVTEVAIEVDEGSGESASESEEEAEEEVVEIPMVESSSEDEAAEAEGGLFAQYTWGRLKKPEPVAEEQEVEAEEEAEVDVIHATPAPLAIGVKSDWGSWERHTKGIGLKLLGLMGYQAGMGLGPRGYGRVDPIVVNVEVANAGNLSVDYHTNPELRRQVTSDTCIWASSCYWASSCVLAVGLPFAFRAHFGRRRALWHRRAFRRRHAHWH